MDNKIYQDIFNVIQPLLFKEWKKMILFVGYTSGSYTMKYYTFDESGGYTDCFNQPGVTKTQVIRSFISIDKIVRNERDKLDDKNKWSVMTMIVLSDGTMKAEFNYEDISENAIEYEAAWKRKYLI